MVDNHDDHQISKSRREKAGTRDRATGGKIGNGGGGLLYNAGGKEVQFFLGKSHLMPKRLLLQKWGLF